jgi:hypothetical protein
MLAANYVVEAGILFGNEAVFATMTDALGYLSAESVANVTGHKKAFGELSPWPSSECAL